MYLFFVFGMDRFGHSKIITLQGYEFFNLGTFFVAGSALASIRFERFVAIPLLFLSFGVLLVALYLGYYNLVKHLFFPILILSIGFMALPFLSTFGKYGDLSYGIYIYSFPIQQTLICFFYFNVHELMIFSLVLSVIFGYISWHCVEKHALLLKKECNVQVVIK